MPRRGAGPGSWIAIAGARPNYVKLGPLVRAARAAGQRLDWIETGQHTAAAMTAAIARDLALPAPLVRLRAPVAGPQRVAQLADALATELAARRPSLVVVVGDVDSTLAGAWAAWRLDLPLAHIEAGLRCFEPRMPEERNRRQVDALSDRLYLTEPGARAHLLLEGVANARIRSPGNVMADALWAARDGIEAEAGRAIRGLPRSFVVATMHRQANVDDPRRLAKWMEALVRVARDQAVILPVHPRTRARLGAWRGAPGLRLRGPMSYLRFLGLVSRAQAVVTDSGGLQVEAAVLGIPCVTLRRRTEHALTVTHGRNIVVGADPRRLPGALCRALAGGERPARHPRAWDGHAAERIVLDWLEGFPRPARLAGPPTQAPRRDPNPLGKRPRIG